MDVRSGGARAAGLLARLFIDNGNVVHGVEPNRAMAEAAMAALGATGRFHDVDGRAEATTLETGSVDLGTPRTIWAGFRIGLR